MYLKRLFLYLISILLLTNIIWAQPNDIVGVVVHIIGDDQGNGYLPEADARTAIQNVSNDFNVINIDFIVVKVVKHDNSNFITVSENTFELMLELYNEYSPFEQAEKAVNVYFVPALLSARGIATLPPSRALLVGEIFENEGIVIQNNSALTSTVTHEFGHYFGLFHTYETAIGLESPVRGMNANCSVAGDLLCDTAAEPDPSGFAKENWNFACEFIGKKTTNGIPYEPDVNQNSNNFMTSSPNNPACRTAFTSGQQAVMLDSIMLIGLILKDMPGYSLRTKLAVMMLAEHLLSMRKQLNQTIIFYMKDNRPIF